MRWPEKPTHLSYVKNIIKTRGMKGLLPYSDYEFVNRIIIEDGMSVLDVGCFDGRDLRQLWFQANDSAKDFNEARNKDNRHLWAKNPNSKFVGVDVLEVCIEHCLDKHNDTDIEFILADANALPFKDKEFDVVYCNGLFSDMEDPSMARKEVLRVGKKVYICDLDKDNEFTYEIY